VTCAAWRSRECVPQMCEYGGQDEQWEGRARVAHRNATDCPTLRRGPDRRVPPRDGNVCKRIRRGVLVTPDESGWIIKRDSADPTSGSLRGMETCANEFGGACLSRPMNRDGSSSVIQRTRQAGPSERIFGGACLSRPMNRDGSSSVIQRTRQAGPSEVDATNGPSEERIAKAKQRDATHRGSDSTPEGLTWAAISACGNARL
jgi:hypothetical protein